MFDRITRTGPLAVCLTLALSVGASAQSLSIGGQNGVNVGVGTSNGLSVDASAGGSNGVNANATVGGGSNIANVDAKVGGSGGVNAKATVGGNSDLADVNATIGGTGGVNAGATVGGSDALVDVDSAIGGPADGTPPVADGNGGTLTPAQQQALNDMSDSERRALLVRCEGIKADSYDQQLVSLCQLLKLSAIR